MIFTVIAALLIVYSFFNFKKSFLAYILLDLVWFANAKVISVAGLPSIPLYMMTSFAFAFVYFLKGKHKRRAVPCPYIVPLLLMSLARFSSCLTSMTGFADQFARALGYLFHDAIEVWILWRVLETDSDFKKLFKGFTIIILLGCIYGVFEYMTGDNPIVDFKSTLTPEGITIYGIDDYRGFRMTSFIEHPIGTGMTFGLYFVMVFIMVFAHKKKVPLKRIAIVTALACLPCILITKMRAGVLFTVIAALAFINFKKKSTYSIIACLAVAVVFAFPVFSDNINIVLSLFSEKARANVGGSSIEMRFLQLGSAFEILKLSPLTGLGDRFMEAIDKLYLHNAFGFESFVFEELTQHGIIGIVTSCATVYYTVVRIPRQFKCREIRYISLAYWLTYLLTSIPFFRMNMYYFVLFYCIKNTTAYRSRYAMLFEPRTLKTEQNVI